MGLDTKTDWMTVNRYVTWSIWSGLSNISGWCNGGMMISKGKPKELGEKLPVLLHPPRSLHEVWHFLITIATKIHIWQYC
jgi:hypothetical protein